MKRIIGIHQAASGANGVHIFGYVCVALALLAVGAPPAAAQFGCSATGNTVSLGPAYLDAVDGGQSLGVDGALGWCRADYDARSRLPRATYTGVGATGALPFNGTKLPQNLIVAGWAGRVVSLTERAEDEGGDLNEIGPAFRFDYGVAGFGVRLGYESSTDFEEQSVAGGAELRWVHPNLPLAPSIVLGLDAVRPVRSEVRDTLGAADEVHGRLGGQLYWLVPLGGVFDVELDGRYFIGFGIDEVVAAAGLDDGAFLSTRLSAALGRSLGPILLERVFVGYGYGRQPTDTEQRKAWTVGARLGAS